MESSSIMEQKLQVLYEDNHLIAVFKPHRLLTQGDETQDFSLMDLTKAWLKAKYHKPGKVFLGMVHRLDRPVAGLVLFAKTSKGASRISEQVRARSFEKQYWALVEGTPRPNKARLRHYLSYDNAMKKSHAHETVAEGRLEATLQYEVLQSWGEQSLLSINLETGRKHQIRVQLSKLGHPILGDRKYGAKLPYEEFSIALVAYKLRFTHPTEKNRIEVTLPASFKPTMPKGKGKYA